MNFRSNNLRIYYIEQAQAVGVENYNYMIFAKQIGIPYSSVKRYLAGGNIGEDYVCHQIEIALEKPEHDMDVPRDEVKWPLEFGYWNHPQQRGVRHATMVAEDRVENKCWSLDELKELREHLLLTFTMEQLKYDEVIRRFMEDPSFM